MKRSILILATGIFLVAGMSMFTSCESSEHSEHKEQLNTNDGDIYACPMHHGTTGKKGDVCETCGMSLTNTKTDPTHKDHNH